MRTRLKPTAVAIAIGLCLAPGFAAAQSEDSRYESALLRLSEILGAVHFLSGLCGSDGEPGLWRRQMEQLIAAEEAFPQRRRLMTIRFNRGFSTYSEVYRTCTGAARQALERYRREGGEITQELVALYGRQ